MANTKEIEQLGVKCLDCGDEIFSAHRHDFVTCSCGKCSVDGGHEYLRIVGDKGKFLAVTRKAFLHTLTEEEKQARHDALLLKLMEIDSEDN